MRRVIILFLFFIPSIVYAQNHAQYKNKTNEQLSGLRRGQTNITWDTFINNFFGPLNSAIQRQFKESYIIGYDYPDIHTAISAIGSNQGAITIVDSQAVTQSSRYIIPSNISIFVTDAGFLYLDKQLTINGKFYAGLSQAFKGNLDSLKFGVGSVDYIRPEWFGGLNSLSLQYAINSITNKGKVLLGSWNYTINSTITIPSNSDSIIIIGNKSNTLFNRVVDDTVFALYGTSKTDRVENIIISGIKFTGSSSFTSPYIYASYFGKSIIEKFNFEDVTGAAVRLVQPWDITIRSGRFDRCGKDGDFTKSALTITSGIGDNANNVRIIDVTFENGRGGHLSILGENGGGLDHGFYIIQSKFHGWGDSTSRATYNPTSPFIYADSLENLSILQCRFAWSPDSGPIVKIVKASNVSFFQNDFAAILNHPAFDISNSIGVSFIANSFNSSGQTESDSLFGSILNDNQMVTMIGNSFITGGELFSQWSFTNNSRFTFNDTADFKILKFTQIDSALAGDYLYLKPDDISYKSLRIRSDGRIILKEGPSATNAVIYANSSGLLVSQNGFITMGNAYTGTSLQTDSLRVVAIANTNTPSGATAYALPIYNKSGSLIGYIPVYPSQW